MSQSKRSGFNELELWANSRIIVLTFESMRKTAGLVCSVTAIVSKTFLRHKYLFQHKYLPLVLR
jgi:hypothetical protein